MQAEIAMDLLVTHRQGGVMQIVKVKVREGNGRTRGDKEGQRAWKVIKTEKEGYYALLGFTSMAICNYKISVHLRLYRTHVHRCGCVERAVLVYRTKGGTAQ